MVEMVGELQSLSRADLHKKFGAKDGAFVYNLCRGVKHSEIKQTGPPKAISLNMSLAHLKNNLPRAREAIHLVSQEFADRSVDCCLVCRYPLPTELYLCVYQIAVP